MRSRRQVCAACAVPSCACLLCGVKLVCQAGQCSHSTRSETESDEEKEEIFSKYQKARERARRQRKRERKIRMETEDQLSSDEVQPGFMSFALADLPLLRV